MNNDYAQQPSLEQNEFAKRMAEMPEAQRKAMVKKLGDLARLKVMKEPNSSEPDTSEQSLEKSS